MTTVDPATAPALKSCSSTPSAVEPVGEVADGLVVGEVGLADPPGRAVPEDAEDLAVGGVLAPHREAGVVDGLGPDDGARALDDLGLELGARLGDVPGQREGQLLEPDVGDGADDVDLEPALLEVGLDHLGEVARVGHVGLVEDDDAGALGERPATEAVVGDVGRELGLDDVEVAHRVAAGLERRAVDDVDEHRAPLDVAQELQAETLALARAGDEARDVGDREAARAGRDDTEVGDERRERVVGDLGLGRAERPTRARTCRRSGSR